jgi:cell division protein FtsZ
MINFHPSSNGELKPRITVIGIGGAGGNAVNNMIQSHLEGVEFIVANTDAQAMSQSRTDRRIQLGAGVTQGLGAGARPDIGRAAAEETLEEILGQLQGSNMVFITAGMGGGTGTGAAPVIARAAREHGILTVGVVTKPFNFEGQHRMRLAEAGIEELSQFVDTLIIIPNQNLFRIASERTTFADAFKMADDVLYSGVRGVTDLMIMPGLINLDFADIRTVMSEMGKAMMGTGEAEGEKRALEAAEAAISNPLLEDISMKGARGVLINITGGLDMTLFEVDEAANRIRDEVDPDANIIFGSTFDEKLEGKMRVSVVATGIDVAAHTLPKPTLISLVEQRRQAVAGQAVQAKSRPTLAEQVAGTAHVFEGSAAVAQPQPAFHSEPVVAQGHDFDEETAYEEEAIPVVAPAPQAAPAFARESEPVLRAEPTLTVRHEPAPALRMEPAQGSLRIDAPPRPELRAEPRLDLRRGMTAPSPAARPVQQPVEPKPAVEQPRRSSFLNRLASHVKPYATPAATPRHEPGPAVQRPAPAAAPGVGTTSPQPARISPADRPPVARTDEDLLDIPAFLRRQAN